MSYKNFIPSNFADFLGQEHVVDDLRVHVKASNDKSTALEHVLFFGPPGLGKTTLARILANECNVNIIEKGATSFKSQSDIECELFNIKNRDILFIDEIHRLPKKVSEALYTPLESYTIDGLKIKPFTLVGATNYAGDLDKPLRDRITHKYDFREYAQSHVTSILMKMGAPESIAVEISERARNNPRVARDLLKKIDNQRNFDGDTELLLKHCQTSFKRMEIDNLGLNRQDILILKYLAENGAGSRSRAIGERALCTVMNIDHSDYNNMVEPHLLRIGFIQRTSRGRIITRDGIRYLSN